MLGSVRGCCNWIMTKRKSEDMEESSDWRNPTLLNKDVTLLSLDILEEIFLNLPPDFLVCVCRLVCRQWKYLVDIESFWRERCRREGYHLPVREDSQVPSNWRLFYFLCKKRRNLIKNPRGEEQFNNWTINKNGGDGWGVERVFEKHPDATVKTNFVTSFGMCEKYQTIDLKREGYNSYFMDNFQPDIRICEWYTARFDCPCKYNIRVELLNERRRPIQVFAPETIYRSAGTYKIWNRMTHTFQKYGPGVRYIRLFHGGIDGRFWKGRYGARITDCCVEIGPEGTA